jgi:adenosylhomocysteine nucleosidase
LALQTGVGQEAARRALDWLATAPKLEEVAYQPKLILCAGFGGALQNNLRVGDLVLATEIVDDAGNAWPTTWPGELHGRWYPPLKRGRVLSLPRLVTDPAEKRRFEAAHEALAVDMESAAIARWCRRRDILFGSLRAISDAADTPLAPELVSLVHGGRVQVGNLMKTLFRRPRLLGELWRLRRNTRLAAEQLGLALGELLTLTLPWFDPDEIEAH